MIKTFDIKIPLILALNLCYVYIISTLNTEISPYVYIMLPAVFIVPSALFLNFLPAMFVVAFSALINEVVMPVRTGLVCALWLSCAYVVHNQRFRFRTLDAFSVISLMLVLNFSILLLYALFLPNGCAGTAEYFYRVAIDVSVSSAVLIAISKFTVTLPADIMRVLGVDISVAEGD